MCATNNPQQIPTTAASNSKSCIAASICTSTTRTAARKTVTFNPVARLHRVRCIHEHLSSVNQTADTLWYGSNEYQAFKARDLKIVEQMMMTKNEQHVDDGESSRGLESYTPKGSKRKRNARVGASNVVLDEQYRQYVRGEDYNPSKIAAQYERISTRVAWAAYQMALKDEQDARMSPGEGQSSPAIAATQQQINIRKESSCPPGTTGSAIIRRQLVAITVGPKRIGGIA